MNNEILRDMLERNHSSAFGWALYSWVCGGEEAAEILRSNHVHILEEGHRLKKNQAFLSRPDPEGNGFEDRLNGNERGTEILEFLERCCI